MKLKTKIGDKSLELIKKYANAHQIAYRAKPFVDISTVKDETIIAYCQKYADAVDKIVTPSLVLTGQFTSDQREALISFASDQGISALRQLSTYPLNEIGKVMLTYNRIKGEIIDSLTQRRAEEYELFTGEAASTTSTNSSSDNTTNTENP